MSYELFKRAAEINDEFEIIPEKVSILAKGIIIDKNGYLVFNNETYIPNLVKLNQLPIEIKSLFLKKLPVISQNDEDKDDENKFKVLNDALYDQLDSIMHPKEGSDMSQELKKANAVCNVADKIISIADLSLKAEIFSHKKRNNKKLL